MPLTRAPLLCAQAQEAGAYAVRIAFGATLLISILVVRQRLCNSASARAALIRAALTLRPSAATSQVFAAITVLLSSSKSDERDNRRSGGSGVVFRPGLFDFYWWDPYAVQRRRQLMATNAYYEMGFLEVRAQDAAN